MGRSSRPKTIEGDWDRFYLEFPDIYDRFARSTPPAVAAIHKRSDFGGKVVIDAGSGTGLSTFELASHARFVVGLEPWDPMREVAARKLRSLDFRNVGLVKGAVEHLPFSSESADFIVSFWGFPFWFVAAGPDGLAIGHRFVEDAGRVLRPGGMIVAVGAAPGWDMGEPTPILRPEGATGASAVHDYMTALGFSHFDTVVEGDYGSVSEAVVTYGFIYGQAAIDYLIATTKRSIQWPLRIHERLVT